jgi:putative protease
MAARKKAKSRRKPKAKAKRRKAPARKRALRRKAPKPRKRAVARRKPAKKRARAVARKPRAARVETLPGERIGVVTHYFSHLSVAVLKLDPGAMLRVGDRIHIKGHTTDFGQRVDSLQVEHQPVMQVGPADDFGLKVTDHAREHDIVYRVL